MLSDKFLLDRYKEIGREYLDFKSKELEEVTSIKEMIEFLEGINCSITKPRIFGLEN